MTRLITFLYKLLIIAVLIVRKITADFYSRNIVPKVWCFTFMITCLYWSKVNKCSLKYQKELYFFIIVGLVKSIWTILKYSWNKFDTEFLEAIYLIKFMLKISKPQVCISIYLVGVYYDRKNRILKIQLFFSYSVYYRLMLLCLDSFSCLFHPHLLSTLQFNAFVIIIITVVRPHKNNISCVLT